MKQDGLIMDYGACYSKSIIKGSVLVVPGIFFLSKLFRGKAARLEETKEGVRVCCLHAVNNCGGEGGGL